MPTAKTKTAKIIGGVLTGTLLVGGLAAAVPAAAVPIAAPPTATTAVASEPTVPTKYVPKIAWRSCGAELAAFQCATVRVPRDYDRPGGAKTKLALTRLPAADPAQKIGTLFTNPGGPGGSGVQFVQSAAQLVYPQSIRDRFDIFGFDPRGVAASDPATCFRSAAAERRKTAGLPAFPINASEVAGYKAANRTLAEACARTSPERFSHASTANVARDMDLLRRAVGDAKLSYAGYSYGTYLGATYAALFPNNMRAMALDGTVDPREWAGAASRYAGVPIGNRIEQDRGGAEVFAQLLEQCRLAGAERCSLAGVGDPQTVARKVLDRLKVNSATVALPDGTELTLTYQLTVAAIFPQLYGVTGWADVADLLTALSVATGVVTPAAADLADTTVDAGVAALLQQAAPKAKGRGADYASLGGALASLCVDTRTVAPANYRRAANQADVAFPDFGRFRTWTDLPCAYLEANGIADDDAYTGPWKQRTTTPVLVLGTVHDPATPYKNTEPYADLFKKATVVTLDGWGHTTIGQSACTDSQVAGYLLDPTAARSDVVCPSDLKPFTMLPEATEDRAEVAARALTGVR